jgi:hypothetical protein
VRLLTLRDLDERSIFKKLRDGTARLWTPYL